MPRRRWLTISASAQRRHRTFRRLEVIVDGAVGDPRFGEMIGEQFRLDHGQAAVIALEPQRHLMVQAATAVAQQRTVGRILHQRVAEAVDRFRRLLPVP